MFVNKQRTLESDSMKSLSRRAAYYKSRADICVSASQKGRLPPTAKPHKRTRVLALLSQPRVAALLFLAETSVPSRPRRTGQLISKNYSRSNIPLLIYYDRNRCNRGNRYTTGYPCTLRVRTPAHVYFSTF